MKSNVLIGVALAYAVLIAGCRSGLVPSASPSTPPILIGNCSQADNPWRSLPPLEPSNLGRAAVSLSLNGSSIGLRTYGQPVVRGVLPAPSASPDPNPTGRVPLPLISVPREGKVHLEPEFYAWGYAVSSGKDFDSAFTRRRVLDWASGSTGDCNWSKHTVAAAQLFSDDSVLVISYWTDTSRDFAWRVVRTP